jgi:3-hydroxybutyryl-CoA dehydrogenase
MDLFGLNLIYDSWQYRQQGSEIAELRPKIIDLLKPRVERGELGVKSGRGFYQYPDANYQQPGFLEAGKVLPEVYNALLTALIGNALVVAANDVLDPADIDRAWMTGMFQSVGPFGLLEKIGVAEFEQILADQVAARFFNSARGKIATGYLRKNFSGS